MKSPREILASDAGGRSSLAERIRGMIGGLLPLPAGGTPDPVRAQ